MCWGPLHWFKLKSRSLYGVWTSVLILIHVSLKNKWDPSWFSKMYIIVSSQKIPRPSHSAFRTELTERDTWDESGKRAGWAKTYILFPLVPLCSPIFHLFHVTLKYQFLLPTLKSQKEALTWDESGQEPVEQKHKGNQWGDIGIYTTERKISAKKNLAIFSPKIDYVVWLLLLFSFSVSWPNWSILGLNMTRKKSALFFGTKLFSWYRYPSG